MLAKRRKALHNGFISQTTSHERKGSQMKTKSKQTVSKKLHLVRIKQNRKSCLQRAKEIEKKLPSLSGELAKKAQRYVYWYRAKAKTFKKAA